MADNNHDLPNSYPLGQGFSAEVRLYLQHWMWRRQLGYILHPRIPINLEPLKIADIACGTGIWVVDLAKELPTADLDGFDISTSFFPHANWLQPNINLSRLNVFNPIPNELVGKYDIVHVGLVVCIVGNDDPTPLLQKLLQLLKPGGFLQWDEADLGGLSRTPATPSLQHLNVDALYTRMDENFKPPGSVSFGWVRRLSERFAEQGMRTVVDEYHPITDDIARPWTCMHVMSVAELIRGSNFSENSAEDWWELWGKAVQETQSGVSIRMGMVVTVGQKQGLPAGEIENK